MLVILDKKIRGDELTEEDFRRIRNVDGGNLVREVCALEPGDGDHKQIHYQASPQKLSIISAQRFEKILKRRYTSEAYRKDRDIYYIISNGIDAKNIFTGDMLLDNLDKLYLSYVNNNEKQS